MKEDLSPLKTDTAFIALIQTQPTPFVFLMRKCGIAIKPDLAIYLIEKISGMMTISQNYFVYKNALYIGEQWVLNGDSITTDEAIEKIKNGEINITLNAQKLIKDFNEKKFEPLMAQVNVYRNFLKVCESSLSLAEALENSSMKMSEWKKLKSSMHKYSLGEPMFAVSLKLNGHLATLLHRQFGNNMADEIEKILSHAIGHSR